MTAVGPRRETLATLVVPLAALIAALFLIYEFGDSDGSSVALDSRDWIPYPLFALLSTVAVHKISRGWSRPRGYLFGGFVYFAYTFLLIAVWLVIVTLNGGRG